MDFWNRRHRDKRGNEAKYFPDEVVSDGRSVFASPLLVDSSAAYTEKFTLSNRTAATSVSSSSSSTIGSFVTSPAASNPATSTTSVKPHPSGTPAATPSATTMMNRIQPAIQSAPRSPEATPASASASAGVSVPLTPPMRTKAATGLGLCTSNNNGNGNHSHSHSNDIDIDNDDNITKPPSIFRKARETLESHKRSLHTTFANYNAAEYKGHASFDDDDDDSDNIGAIGNDGGNDERLAVSARPADDQQKQSTASNDASTDFFSPAALKMQEDQGHGNSAADDQGDAISGTNKGETQDTMDGDQPRLIHRTSDAISVVHSVDTATIYNEPGYQLQFGANGQAHVSTLENFLSGNVDAVDEKDADAVPAPANGKEEDHAHQPSTDQAEPNSQQAHSANNLDLFMPGANAEGASPDDTLPGAQQTQQQQQRQQTHKQHIQDHVICWSRNSTASNAEQAASAAATAIASDSDANGAGAMLPASTLSVRRIPSKAAQQQTDRRSSRDSARPKRRSHSAGRRPARGSMASTSTAPMLPTGSTSLLPDEPKTPTRSGRRRAGRRSRDSSLDPETALRRGRGADPPSSNDMSSRRSKPRSASLDPETASRRARSREPSGDAKTTASARSARRAKSREPPSSSLDPSNHGDAASRSNSRGRRGKKPSNDDRKPVERKGSRRAGRAHQVVNDGNDSFKSPGSSERRKVPSTRGTLERKSSGARRGQRGGSHVNLSDDENNDVDAAMSPTAVATSNEKMTSPNGTRTSNRKTSTGRRMTRAASGDHGDSATVDDKLLSPRSSQRKKQPSAMRSLERKGSSSRRQSKSSSKPTVHSDDDMERAITRTPGNGNERKKLSSASLSGQERRGTRRAGRNLNNNNNSASNDATDDGNIANNHNSISSNNNSSSNIANNSSYSSNYNNKSINSLNSDADDANDSNAKDGSASASTLSSQNRLERKSSAVRRGGSRKGTLSRSNTDELEEDGGGGRSAQRDWVRNSNDNSNNRRLTRRISMDSNMRSGGALLSPDAARPEKDGDAQSKDDAQEDRDGGDLDKDKSAPETHRIRPARRNNGPNGKQTRRAISCESACITPRTPMVFRKMTSIRRHMGQTSNRGLMGHKNGPVGDDPSGDENASKEFSSPSGVSTPSPGNSGGSHPSHRRNTDRMRSRRKLHAAESTDPPADMAHNSSNSKLESSTLPSTTNTGTRRDPLRSRSQHRSSNLASPEPAQNDGDKSTRSKARRHQRSALSATTTKLLMASRHEASDDSGDDMDGKDLNVSMEDNIATTDSTSNSNNNSTSMINNKPITATPSSSGRSLFRRAISARMLSDTPFQRSRNVAANNRNKNLLGCQSNHEAMATHRESSEFKTQQSGSSDDDVNIYSDLEDQSTPLTVPPSRGNAPETSLNTLIRGLQSDLEREKKEQERDSDEESHDDDDDDVKVRQSPGQPLFQTMKSIRKLLDISK